MNNLTESMNARVRASRTLHFNITAENLARCGA
jgi:hypothetical protein